MKLMREWRCFPEREPVAGGPANSWAGSPGNAGLGTFWTLRAVVSGAIGEQTGHIRSINDVDAMVREGALPALRAWLGEKAHTAGALAEALQAAFRATARRCPTGVSLDSLELHLCPQLSLTTRKGEESMVRFTQSFEFAASHRLYCAAWSEEENRRVFGKCANVNGHGHNYIVEVTVSGQPDGRTGSVADVENVQRLMKERVLNEFDHKYLNLDCKEFASINPSVENIAKVIWNRLNGGFERCRLSRIRVWETEKTYAEYDGTD